MFWAEISHFRARFLRNIQSRVVESGWDGCQVSLKPRIRQDLPIVFLMSLRWVHVTARLVNFHIPCRSTLFISAVSGIASNTSRSSSSASIIPYYSVAMSSFRYHKISAWSQWRLSETHASALGHSCSRCVKFTDCRLQIGLNSTILFLSFPFSFYYFCRIPFAW